MLQVEELKKHHNRKHFDCGDLALNSFLQVLARQQQDKGISKTFVLCDSANPTTILAFFALAACEVVSDDLPLPLAKRYPTRAPGAKLARLAVDRRQQRKGYGQILMVEAMRKALLVADHIGIIGFFVDAKNHASRVYYDQFGFISFPNHPMEMFLPLTTMRQAIDATTL
jgi:GNAT superfamily N-acetyltransferase